MAWKNKFTKKKQRCQEQEYVVFTCKCSPGWQLILISHVVCTNRLQIWVDLGSSTAWGKRYSDSPGVWPGALIVMLHRKQDRFNIAFGLGTLEGLCINKTIAFWSPLWQNDHKTKKCLFLDLRDFDDFLSFHLPVICRGREVFVFF